MIPREIADVLNPSLWPLFVLVLARIGGFLFYAPFLSAPAIPARVRAAFSVAIALLLMPLVRSNPFPVVSAASLPVLVFAEVVIGAVIGLSASVFVAALSVAGEYIGIQSGLSVATALDPTAQGHQPVLTTFLQLFSGAVFFALGGHLVLLSTLAESFRWIGPGTALHYDNGFLSLLPLFGQVWAGALMIAAPVLVTLLAAKVVFGVLARTSPQLNVFVASFPVTIALGFIVIAFTLPALAALVHSWVDLIPDVAARVLEPFTQALR